KGTSVGGEFAGPSPEAPRQKSGLLRVFVWAFAGLAPHPARNRRRVVWHGECARDPRKGSVRRASARVGGRAIPGAYGRTSSNAGRTNLARYQCSRRNGLDRTWPRSQRPLRDSLTTATSAMPTAIGRSRPRGEIPATDRTGSK